MYAFVTTPLVPRRARVSGLSSSPPGQQSFAGHRSTPSRMLAERGGPRAAPLTSSMGIANDGDGRGRVEIQRPAFNKRVVTSDLIIHAPINVVWDVLSDYERLDEYIPNLAMSRRLPHPHPSGVRLEQCGVQSILGFEFRASVVLDMAEVNRESLHSRCINFDLVKSRDFREFSGHWRMEAVPEFKTALFYSVAVVPKGLVPVKAIEWRISEDVPQNMDAVKRHCERQRRATVAAARRALEGGTRQPDSF
jgi:Polyketide cyclase / dehydrase and lipid transport